MDVGNQGGTIVTCVSTYERVVEGNTNKVTLKRGGWKGDGKSEVWEDLSDRWDNR